MRRCPAAEAWQEWDLKPARRSGVLVERVRPGGAGVLEEKTRVIVRTRVGAGWLTECRAGQESGLTSTTQKEN